MKLLALALLVGVLGCAPNAYALFFNDSNVIEIGDGEPPVTGPSVSGSGVGGGAGPGSGGQGSAGGSSGGSSGGVNYGFDFSGGSGSAQGSSGNVPQSGAGQEDAVTEEEQRVIDALRSVLEDFLLSGAVRGTSGSGTLDFLNATEAFGSRGTGSISTAERAAEIVIDGDAVRSALVGRIDLKDILASYTVGTSAPSAREYGLLAASTALSDRNIANITFTATAFDIKYRSRGYLFGIIPITFPVRLHVIPSAQPEGERISVRLPWYRFFVREFFTPAGLSSELNAVLTTKMEELSVQKVEDPNLALFKAVADFLRRKIGTVADTIAQ